VDQTFLDANDEFDEEKRTRGNATCHVPPRDGRVKKAQLDPSPNFGV